MNDESKDAQLTLSTLTIKTVIVHTITYFIAGVLAYKIGGYEKTFSQPPLSYFMRPTTDRIVMAGPLFQPIRGVIFALALYPLRSVLFAKPRGWLVLWWLLLALGVFSTFGPAAGSVEGLIYTTIPARGQIFGLWEVLLQSLLFSAILFYWVNHPEKKWLNWTLGVVFFLLMGLIVLGLVAGPARSPETFPLDRPFYKCRIYTCRGTERKWNDRSPAADRAPDRHPSPALGPRRADRCPDLGAVVPGA